MVYLIAVGKLKDPALEALERDYKERMHPHKLEIIEIKSKINSACKDAIREGLEKEGEEVVRKIEELSKGSSRKVILLAEQGKLFDSTQFSQMIFNLVAGGNQAVKKIFFVIGGAHGHGPAVLKIHDQLISLSPLTFPHRIARIVFVEQFYRAQTIHSRHPYHH